MSRYTEKKKLSNQRWDAANLDRVSVVLPRGTKERIKAAAAHQGVSANRFMQSAIIAAIKTDDEKQRNP